MKKLLVLMLVLAMGGLARAGLSLEVTDNQISILLDEGSANLISYDLKISVDAGLLDTSAVNINPSGKTWMAAAKIDSQAEQWLRITAADIQMFGGTGLAAPNAILTGLGVVGAQQYTVTLWSFDAASADGSNVVGELASVFVPEPMSMLLLGLGGLFLRRRK